MAPNVQAFSALSATGGSTSVSAALPATVLAGASSYLLLQMGGNVTISGLPTGWSVVAGPTQAGTAANCYEALIKKDPMLGSEGGTAFTCTLSAAVRWAVAGVVVSGGSLDAVSSYQGTGTAGTTGTIPTYTPVAADCVAVAFAGMTSISGVGSITSTIPGPWVETVDVSTTTNSLDVSAYIATQQLAGQAGTAQGATTLTSNVSHRTGGWVVTFAPAADSAPVANAGPDQANVEPFATTTLDGSGSSDPDSDPITYTWSQTAGPAVALSDVHAQKPSFAAPATTSGTTLTFSLVVNDGTLSSGPDTVSIAVLPHTIWQAGSPMKPIQIEQL